MGSLTSFMKKHAGKMPMAQLFYKHLSNYGGSNGKEKLPINDKSCANQVLEAMDAYFLKRNTSYLPNDNVTHSFIDFAEQDASESSLREIFYLFITEDNKGLPENNSKCRRVVEKGIDTFFSNCI